MRILGITIPDDKRLEIGLTSIYGIGRSKAHELLDAAKLEYGLKPKDVSADAENILRKLIEDGDFKVEGDLKREKSMTIKRLKDIRSYRGTRHSLRLPVRGQSSKSNSRTVRGNVRKTMGSGRTKIEKT